MSPLTRCLLLCNLVIHVSHYILVNYKTAPPPDIVEYRFWVAHVKEIREVTAEGRYLKVLLLYWSTDLLMGKQWYHGTGDVTTNGSPKSIWNCMLLYERQLFLIYRQWALKTSTRTTASDLGSVLPTQGTAQPRGAYGETSAAIEPVVYSPIRRDPAAGKIWRNEVRRTRPDPAAKKIWRRDGCPHA